MVGSSPIGPTHTEPLRLLRGSLGGFREGENERAMQRGHILRLEGIRTADSSPQFLLTGWDNLEYELVQLQQHSSKPFITHIIPSSVNSDPRTAALGKDR